jgi:gluconolactonase
MFQLNLNLSHVMKPQHRILTGLVFLSMFMASIGYGQPPAQVSGGDGYATLVADGATPQLISKQFSFTEGPAVDKKGNVFFSDQPNDKIWKYGTDGKLTVFLDKTRRSNGMYFDAKGNLITCADAENEILSIDKRGNVTVLLKDYEGKKLNGPNDLWIHPTTGGIYFTDPYYQRNYWTRKKPDIEKQNVYYLAKGKSVAVPVIENLNKPNGIVGTPDGKTLYIGDTGGRKTYQYTINGDGSLSEGKVFAEVGSDGMALDNLGNLYLTTRGVSVFNPEGKKIAQIAISSYTSNVVFGGKNLDKLFITSLESIYVLDMKVKGAK